MYTLLHTWPIAFALLYSEYFQAKALPIDDNPKPYSAKGHYMHNAQ